MAPDAFGERIQLLWSHLKRHVVHIATWRAVPSHVLGCELRPRVAGIEEHKEEVAAAQKRVSAFINALNFKAKHVTIECGCALDTLHPKREFRDALYASGHAL